MLGMLALGGLSLAGNVLSGIGAKQASGKQARLQMIADANAAAANAATMAEVNAKREQLGRELLTIPEVTERVEKRNFQSTTENESSSRTDSASHNYSYVDVDNMMAAAERAGFNPVTWLNAGAMAAYTQTGTVGSESTYSSSRSLSTDTGWGSIVETRAGHNASDAFKIMVPEYQLQQASQVPAQHSVLQSIGTGLTSAANVMSPILQTEMRIDAANKLAAKNGATSYGNSLSGGGTGGGSAITLGGATGVNRGLSTSTGPGSKSSSSDKDYEAEKLVDYYEVLRQIGQPRLMLNNAEVKYPTFTHTSYDWPVSKHSPDAEVGEARGGELRGEVSGIVASLDDEVLGWSGRTLRDWGRVYGFNPGDYAGKTKGEKIYNWWNGVGSEGAAFSRP